MHQHPAEVWNAIAETQSLRTDWARAMFPLPQDLMDQEVEAEQAYLAKEMGSARMALAYLTVMPLLWEAAAVEAFKATGAALGEGLTPMPTQQMAVIAASRDYALTMQEQKQLEKKLSTPPKA